MNFYPIVQKNCHQTESGGCRPLPLFYMTDYSVLGFQVSDCEQAAQVLDLNAFALKRASGGVEVAIDEWSRLKDVVDLLNSNGITCQIADIAEGIYQG